MTPDGHPQGPEFRTRQVDNPKSEQLKKGPVLQLTLKRDHCDETKNVG